MVWTPERLALAQAEAASWRGTPHKNKLAIRGVGIDCLNLVVEILRAAGVLPQSYTLPNYTVNDGLHDVSTALETAVENTLCVQVVPLEEAQAGDVMTFKTGGRSAHLGILLGEPVEVWHALAGRCVTRSPWKLWRHEVSKVYRICQIAPS